MRVKKKQWVRKQRSVFGTDGCMSIQYQIANTRRVSLLGFCYFNSVAVAAKHAIATGRSERVAIIDWDVHHGNGTQDLTYDDSNILYVSLHRFGDGFFPETGSHVQVSDGTNINIAWTYANMGNTEYAAAFSEIILPILSEWSPDLILVSCGFDAAKGDLLGDCDLSPEMYFSMTKSLLQVCGAPIVVALEGGYNLDVIAQCMEAVTLALLEEPYSLQDKGSEALISASEKETNELKDLNISASDRLEAARKSLAPYWDRKNQSSSGRIKPGAAKCLNKTMAAIERSPLWADRITWRRFVPSIPDRTMPTRRYKRQGQQGDDLCDAMKTLEL